MLCNILEICTAPNVLPQNCIHRIHRTHICYLVLLHHLVIFYKNYEATSCYATHGFRTFFFYSAASAHPCYTCPPDRRTQPLQNNIRPILFLICICTGAIHVSDDPTSRTTEKKLLFSSTTMNNVTSFFLLKKKNICNETCK